MTIKIMRVKLDNYEKLLEFDFFYIVSRFFEKWNQLHSVVIVNYDDKAKKIKFS